MTTCLIKFSTKSSKLYQKCIGKSRTHSTYVHYVTYINIYNKLKHIAKTTYYANLLQKIKNDYKKTWQFLRTIIGIHNDKSCIPTHFKLNTDLINDPDQISNTFCIFVTNVGPSYANAIPKPRTHFNSYLDKSQGNSINSMNPTDAIEISQKIRSFQRKKSCGSDNLSQCSLKQIGEQVSLPIAILINKSLSEGIVPDELKIANVVPVYKSKAFIL